MTSSKTAWASVALSLVLQLGCRGTNVLPDTEEARRLAADLRLQLHQASDASNQAVMAETDETSISFAHAAEKATASVERETRSLGPLLQKLRFSSELLSLEEFKRHWVEYESIDHKVLALAVENTNRKAQRLSFGAAREAADAVRDSITSGVASMPGHDHCRANELAQIAIGAVREIQFLQSPHIAEAEDATMTRLEQQMAALDARAREALKTLSELADPASRKTLESAAASLDKFNEFSRQIVALSRTNTNVHSLALSLDEKPPLLTACDASLNTMQQALANEGASPAR